MPQLWHPQTGEISPVSYKIENGRTFIPIEMDSWEAYFIVFGEKTSEKSFTLAEKEEEELLTINSPWIVNFQEGRGAPQQATFEELVPWTENEDQDIKYFSGTASYQTSFEVTDLPEDAELILDLGEVNNLAEVIVNGQSLGVVWKTPFRTQINEALQPGQNTLEVRVTNVWVNRLIGDAQAEVKEKITFTTLPFYQANSELLPSGLLARLK